MKILVCNRWKSKDVLYIYMKLRYRYVSIDILYIHCLYKHICVYMHIYKGIYIYRYIKHIYIFIYIYIHIDIYRYLYVYIYIHIYIYIGGRPWFDPSVGRTCWRREWLPTPIVLPGEFHGQGYSSLDGKESDSTEQLTILLSFSYTYV